MYVFNIAIIGAGQLGARHLQGVGGIAVPSAVYIVDTNQASLEKARTCYEEVTYLNKHVASVDYLTEVLQLPQRLDLVIISTGSLPRAQLTEELVAKKTVKYILFEKFLFPSISSYAAVSSLMVAHKIKSWVNCPRRTLKLYKELQQLFKGKGSITFHVTGGSWGLGCNSIHYMDIFSMLTGEQDITVNVDDLEPEVHQSKRQGYIELFGTITGQSPSGHKIILISDIHSSHPPVITIQADHLMVTIREGIKEVTVSGSNGEMETRPFEFPFQSELSGKIAEQILTHGESDLTAYVESATLHLHFLKPVVKWYNGITGSGGDYCPIT